MAVGRPRRRSGWHDGAGTRRRSSILKSAARGPLQPRNVTSALALTAASCSFITVVGARRIFKDIHSFRYSTTALAPPFGPAWRRLWCLQSQRVITVCAQHARRLVDCLQLSKLTSLQTSLARQRRRRCGAAEERAERFLALGTRTRAVSGRGADSGARDGSSLLTGRCYIDDCGGFEAACGLATTNIMLHAQRTVWRTRVGEDGRREVWRDGAGDLHS